MIKWLFYGICIGCRTGKERVLSMSNRQDQPKRGLRQTRFRAAIGNVASVLDIYQSKFGGRVTYAKIDGRGRRDIPFILCDVWDSEEELCPESGVAGRRDFISAWSSLLDKSPCCPECSECAESSECPECPESAPGDDPRSSLIPRLGSASFATERSGSSLRSSMEGYPATSAGVG